MSPLSAHLEQAGYDIIGDIHGCALTLTHLLKTLGYCMVEGVYRHPQRKALFLGDFIDRGPLQRETIALIRPMLESGAAQAVMGNHEFNAIAYNHFDEVRGDYLRRHTERNRRQHDAFLDAYADSPAEREELIAWFMTLPLWLDLGELRLVHACWDEEAMQRLQHELAGGNRLTTELLVKASTHGSPQFRDVETLLKGKEAPLPEGHHIIDPDGHSWPNIRIRWWDQQASSFHDAFMGPPGAIAHIPDDEIEGDHLIEYSHRQPPVFLGHYWMSAPPAPLADNIACVDYSVAKASGHLAAYRWSGERRLLAQNYVTVARLEP